MNTESLESGIILHELANIGMVIQAGAKVLEDSEPGTRENQLGRTTMLHGANRLTETLSALRVVLGKSGELPPPGPHSLYRVVSNLVNDAAFWQGRNHTIQLTSDRDDFEVFVPDLVRLILRNFIANALNYSPAGSPIEVRIRHSARETRILVCNRGAKIPDQVKACLFEPGCKSEHGGSGIGLHIAQRAALAMQGRIRCLSSKKVTAFCVVFPTNGAAKPGTGFIAA